MSNGKTAKAATGRCGNARTPGQRCPAPVKASPLTVDQSSVTDPATNPWKSVCELTSPAMNALVDVEQALIAVPDDQLTPHEFRALLWVRCSLASLYGIRADEAVGDTEALVV